MSQHESEGLAISAYQPTIASGSYTPRGRLLDDLLGQKFTAETHTVQANGGWWSQRLTLSGNLVDMEEWLDRGLGRHIETYNPALEQIFGGFVNSVTLSAGTLSTTRGPLLDIANRVSVTYTPILDATANPPIVGSQTTTTIADNANSQAQYAIIEQVLNGGQLLDDDGTGPPVVSLAERRRDVYLAENAWPKSSEDLGLGATSEPVIELDILGYVHWLGAYILDDATAATITVSNPAGTGKLQLILAADPNGIFSTDYVQMTTNGLLTSRYEQDNRDAWTAVNELVELGDALNNRYLFGIYQNQRAEYNAIPTSAKYQHRIASRDIEIQPFGGGVAIAPWDVQVGEWVFLPDFLVGRPQPAEFRRDPRYIFIESVTFTAPATAQIRGGNTDTIGQLIAKGGMWG